MIPPDLRSVLVAALRNRLAIIANRALRNQDPAAHLRQLEASSERIVTLQRRLPQDAPPRLVHFLERCSYDKALELLETDFTPEV